MLRMNGVKAGLCLKIDMVKLVYFAFWEGVSSFSAFIVRKGFCAQEREELKYFTVRVIRGFS